MKARSSMVLVCAFALVAPHPPAAAGSRSRDTVAQDIVDRFVDRHPELVSLELAVAGERGCRTIAATAREVVGAMCDAEVLGPMSTGKPAIAGPSRQERLFEVTQALHDSGGTLIGAAGMDLTPDAGRSRDAALTHARRLLRELEQEIPSKAKLMEPASR